MYLTTLCAASDFHLHTKCAAYKAGCIQSVFMVLQAIAAYHGEPSQCTYNNAPVACCVHGMATFPQWHRLFTVQFEQALLEHGLANIGVPYWDWTQPLTDLPELVRVGDFLFRRR